MKHFKVFIHPLAYKEIIKVYYFRYAQLYNLMLSHIFFLEKYSFVLYN